MRPADRIRSAAIYARFSSELQLDRSIEDQVHLCRTFAEKQGYQISHVYSDRARSGSSILGRDGLLSMLEAAKARAFDVVVVEELDRLSRDQEDLAAIFKRLQFIGVDIVAVHAGRADAVQIGIRGLIGSLFLTDLANKTRRGQAGRIKDGLSAGGKAYGYRPVLGKPGELEIDDEEAAIVRRIFAAFAAGSSPRTIAHGLNEDKVPPPRGAIWNASTINGSTTRQNGMLRNSIYVGKLVWNRVRMVRDPDTGRRVSRMNPESEWHSTDVPQLRIVDKETVAAVAARLDGRRNGTKNYPTRNKRILSGLLRCAACGGGMALDGKTKDYPRIRCSRARESGSCGHRRRYQLFAVEHAIIERLRPLISHQAAVALYVETYVAERMRLARHGNASRQQTARELDRRRLELRRLLDAYVAGVVAIPELAERRSALDAQISKLEADLDAVAVDRDALQIAAELAARTDALHLVRKLGQGELADPIRNAIGRLIEAVVVHPTEPHHDLSIELVGKL